MTDVAGRELAASHFDDELVIRPSSDWVSLRLGELWRYRDLLILPVWRDLKVRYQQAVLGVAWAIIQPVVTMLVFGLFLGRLGGIGQRTGGLPYPLYAIVAHALSLSSDSLVANANLIKKVYFPRLIAPLASVSSGLADSGAAFAILLFIQIGCRALNVRQHPSSVPFLWQRIDDIEQYGQYHL